MSRDPVRKREARFKILAEIQSGGICRRNRIRSFSALISLQLWGGRSESFKCSGAMQIIQMEATWEVDSIFHLGVVQLQVGLHLKHLLSFPDGGHL